MFEKFKEKLKKLQEMQGNQYKIDTSEFDDPIADKVDWSPAKGGGTNFKTHNLVKVSSSIYRYQLSMGGKFFIGIFGGIGSIVAIVGFFVLLSSSWVGLFLLIFGSIFSAVAYFMYKTMGNPIVFDRSMGFIWVGRKQPKFAGEQKSKNDMIYFNDIHAIQIISERVRSDKSTYTSYEINMVLKDCTRFNVVDFGNHAQIIEDAKTLSEFIGKPVWDAS